MAFPGHPLGNGLTATAAKASTKQPLASLVLYFHSVTIFVFNPFFSFSGAGSVGWNSCRDFTH